MAEWIIQPRKFDDLIDQVLFNRGVITEKDETTKLDFLKPDFAKLHDPFLMHNIKEAAERIKSAKEKGETIGIFADYDADGIPGAALLYKALKKLDIKSYIFIPSREGGYGLSKEGIDYLKSKNCTLIITVDLGIRNFREAEYSKKIGLDLIITDHHEPDQKIPKADLVINPKIDGDKYPYRDLAGCGVAYKLVCGLSKIYPQIINEAFLKWNLDLVAISTISDVVPLQGENRTLASFGLYVLKKTKNLGLQNLYKTANITPESINAYSVGFQIGPRINAPGRMDHATKSFELLVTENKKEARELAEWLDQKNQARQAAMERVGNEASKKIETEKLDRNNIIVVAGDWVKGVIGPVASRLADKYSRPVIILSKEKDVYSGSARSLEGVNILALVEMSEKYVAKFGGHKGACGLSIMASKYELFIKSILENAQKYIKPEDLIKKIKIDAEIKPAEIKKSLCEKILQLEPFGMGNARPVFALNNASIVSHRLMGTDQRHLSAQIKSGGNLFRIVCFGFTEQGNINNIKSNTLYDFAFTPELNYWNGETNIDLKVVDFRPTGHTEGE